MKCEICEREFKSNIGLGKHLTASHKEISKEEYYKKYLMKDKNDNICKMYGKINSCKKYTKFISITKGFVKYCSTKCLSNDPIVREKYKQTCLKNYNVRNVSQVIEFKEKKKQTCLKNYNVEYPAQSKYLIEKMQQTCFNNYGVINPMNVPAFQKKCSNSCFNNNGVRYPAQSKEIIEKYMKKQKHNFLKKLFKYLGHLKLELLDRIFMSKMLSKE